jgi:tetratricopeptide (TPR) repeat protein
MPESKMTAAEARESPAIPANVFGLNKRELDAIEVLGFLLYQQGRNAEAETIFKGLIALDKRLYQGFAGMGALALAERKLDEAAGWLGQAVERNPNDPTVHANLGETYLRMGKFEPASAAFEKAFKLDPQQKDPGANRARAMLAGIKAVIEEMRKREPANEPE